MEKHPEQAVRTLSADWANDGAGGRILVETLPRTGRPTFYRVEHIPPRAVPDERSIMISGKQHEELAMAAYAEYWDLGVKEASESWAMLPRDEKRRFEDVVTVGYNAGYADGLDYANGKRPK